MKDKDLLLDNNPHTIEELTDQANRIIESLENEKELENSIEIYQKLLKLNNLIEKKFYKDFKNIGEETKNKIKKIINENDKKAK